MNEKIRERVEKNFKSIYKTLSDSAWPSRSLRVEDPGLTIILTSAHSDQMESIAVGIRGIDISSDLVYGIWTVEIEFQVNLYSDPQLSAIYKFRRETRDRSSIEPYLLDLCLSLTESTLEAMAN